MADDNFEEFFEKVKDLFDDGKTLVGMMDELHEWDSVEEIMDNFSAVQKFAQNVVLIVEIATYEIATTLKNKEKLKGATEIIDKYLKLPWYLELIDGMVIHTFLKGAVYFINKSFGNEWDLDAARESLRTGEDFFDVMRKKQVLEE